MKITVECEKPKYAKGNYNYTKLEDVYHFLVGIKGFPKGKIGHWLLGVAKDGSISRVHTARFTIDIKSDFHDYQLAQRIAQKTGLIRAFDRESPNVGVALSFAKAFDKEAR